MPCTFERSGPNIKYVFRCNVCNAYASFGYGVNLSAAIEAKDPKRAGQWYCGLHKNGEAK